MLKNTLLLVIISSMVFFTACKKTDPEIIIETTEVDLTRLPFGDSKILRRDKGQIQPIAGSLWLCAVPANGAGNSNAKDWTNTDGTWDFTRKPTVEGSVKLQSEFKVTLDGLGNRLIVGNGLPSTPVGVFPIEPTSIAYKYDRNPNAIEPKTINFKYPALPKVAAAPSCLTYGHSGISLSGGYIYHAASTLANDASAYEILDSYGGQSDGTKSYHYHFPSPNLLKVMDPAGPGHSTLMGYMKDGFGIYGPRGEDGKVLSSKDLDECHGHTHSVLWDGNMVNLYHYHWTYDFPYNIGCYKGTPQ